MPREFVKNKGVTEKCEKIKKKMKRMLLERVRNDPGVQVTSGKLQATPLGGPPPANTRRSTGPLENMNGIEARKDRFGMYRPVRSLQVTSGKAQVQRQVSSGTGRVPDASPAPPVKRRKRPVRDGNRPKRAYKKTEKFMAYHERRRKRLRQMVDRRNTPESRKKQREKKLKGYQNILKSKLESERRQKRLLVAKLRFCQDYGHKLKIPGDELWRGKLRADKIPDHLRGNKNTGMWT